MKTKKIGDAKSYFNLKDVPFVIVSCDICDNQFFDDSDNPNDYCPRCGRCLHCGR